MPSGPYHSLSRLPAEVWLDADGLARRISVSSEPAAAADAQVWSVVELWDYGLAVDITPPGPDEVQAPAGASRMAEEQEPKMPERTGGDEPTPDDGVQPPMSTGGGHIEIVFPRP